MAALANQFGTYDAATRVITLQTRDEFLEGFAEDIQRALEAIDATPCWLCKQDKGVEAFHACKKDICPTATNDYYLYHADGTPRVAYKAHPLRFSGPRAPSNNAIRRMQREYVAPKAAPAAATAACTLDAFIAASTAPAEKAKTKKGGKKDGKKNPFSLDEI